MPNLTSDPRQQRADLYRFLVENHDLERLTARLEAFNVFRVLRVERTEIRHSNVLAWLLNPRETHNLGDLFLRRFLSRVLVDNPELEVGFSALDVELSAFDDVAVHREHKHVDVLVVNRSAVEDMRWVLLIENKIRAGESKGQLVRYCKAIEQDYPDCRQIRVFLTLDRDDPSEEGQAAGFVPFGHEDVCDLLIQLVEQRGSKLSPEVRTFVDHYIAVLRRMTMMIDPEVTRLCRQIYQNHQAAIDLIREVLDLDSTSPLNDYVKEFLGEGNRNVELLGSSRARTWFVPKTWIPHLAALGGPGFRFLESAFPVACWIYNPPESTRIGVSIEIGPLEPADRRMQLVKDFVTAGFKLDQRAFRERARYTRVYSKYHKLADPEDADEVRDILEKLWTQVQPEIEKASKVITALPASANRSASLPAG